MLPTVTLFGMRIHCVTMQHVIAQVLDWCRRPQPAACRYVVTPNVDHVVMYQHRSELHRAYRDASLVLADGTPLVWASRLLRKPLPERVAGSDLVPQLLDWAMADRLPALTGRMPAALRVFLLGAAPGVADKAAERIHWTWQGVTVVGTYSPPLGFESDDGENARVVQLVAESTPDLLIIGLGAPKQELWVQTHCGQLQAKVALCAGATIDFLAGNRPRSPRWMRHAGLEWLHRASLEPRRLGHRYARDAWEFPQLIWREIRGT